MVCDLVHLQVQLLLVIVFSLPSDMAWGLMMQHVQSVKAAVLEGPCPIVEGKKNSVS